MDIAQLCWQIEANKHGNFTQSNTTSSMVSAENIPWQRSPSILEKMLLDHITKPNSNNTTADIEVSFDMVLKEVEQFTEWYLMTVVAALGIAANLTVRYSLGGTRH